MKLKIFTIASLAVMLFTACDRKPHIIFSETTHNFGKVKVESTLTHTFTFTNKGNATLVIDRIRSG